MNREQEVSRDVSIVTDMLNFLNESWTPFHATGESVFSLVLKHAAIRNECAMLMSGLGFS